MGISIIEVTMKKDLVVALIMGKITLVITKFLKIAINAMITMIILKVIMMLRMMIVRVITMIVKIDLMLSSSI